MIIDDEIYQELCDEKVRMRDLLQVAADLIADFGCIPNTPAAKLEWIMGNREAKLERVTRRRIAELTSQL